MPPPQRVVQEIHGFLGVNLRKDRLSLADEELAKAINADLHSELGTIVLRRGRSALFATPLTDLAIRRIARVNTHRYLVAEQSVYRDERVVIDGLLSATLFTTIVPFRPLNDDTIWAFIADDAVMYKDNGAVIRLWGIIASTAAPTLGATPTGALTGTYRAAFTYTRATGDAVAHESNPSAIATATISGTALAIGDLVDSADPQVTGFGIYRTVTGGTFLLRDAYVTAPTADLQASATFPWEASPAATGLQFQWAIDCGHDLRGSQTWEPAATTAGEDSTGRHATSLWERATYVTSQTRRWTYASTKADSALGVAVELDNPPPPLASWAVNFQEHVMLCRDAANPHYLWFSKRFRPESVPVDNFLEIGNPDDPLECVLPLAGLLGAFTKRTKYRVAGNSTSGFNAQETLSPRGTSAPAAAIAGEQGIVFVARDGVFRTSLVAPDENLSEAIAPLFYGDDVNGIAAINQDAMATAAATEYRQMYFLALPTGTARTPNLLAVFSWTTKRWYFFDHPARSLYDDRITNQLWAGFVNGFAYALEQGTDDGAASISLDVQTKDYVGQSLETRKLFLFARLDADAKSGSIAVDLYVDGTLQRTATVTGTRRRVLLPFPPGAMGYAWRLGVRYTGTERVKIYGAACVFLPLEPV